MEFHCKFQKYIVLLWFNNPFVRTIIYPRLRLCTRNHIFTYCALRSILLWAKFIYIFSKYFFTDIYSSLQFCSGHWTNIFVCILLAASNQQKSLKQWHRLDQRHIVLEWDITITRSQHNYKILDVYYTCELFIWNTWPKENSMPWTVSCLEAKKPVLILW